MERKLSFRIEKETKGALQYKEYTEDGKVADATQMTIGTLYLRKSAVDGKPGVLHVTVSY
jgi:hypothetical protein